MMKINKIRISILALAIATGWGLAACGGDGDAIGLDDGDNGYAWGANDDSDPAPGANDGNGGGSTTPSGNDDREPGSGAGNGNGSTADANDHAPDFGADGSSIFIDFRSTTKDFPNPERGFFRHGDYLDNLDPADLRWIANSEDVRLVFVLGDLRKFRDGDISAKFLEDLNTGFSRIRESGMKAILRFYYNFDSNGSDVPKDRMLGHIRQLESVLKKNEDVIGVMQAGFIGSWAEWHNTKLNIDDKEEVLNRLLQAVPLSRQIHIRRPKDLRHFQPNPPIPDNLRASSRPVSTRLGIHNDCFLASSDDYGTYYAETLTESNRARDYAKSVTEVVGFGGETCVPDKGARMSCDAILKEGREYHATYLSKTWNPDFINGWKKEGCFDEIVKRLGYRLTLKQFQMSKPTSVNQAIRWEVTLKNEGWARPLNSRSLVLRFQNDNTNTTVNRELPGSDLRLVPAGQTVTMSGTINLPPNLRAGEYKILLGAPDPASRLAEDPRYSIRFANADQAEKNQKWLPDQGFMDLGERLVLR